MPELQLLEAALSLVLVALAVSIYRGCARPALAFAGAPPIAFDLALVSLFGTIAVCSVALLDIVAEVPGELSRFVATAGLLSYITLGLAFFRPGWFARLGAGRDATAYTRFLLTWLRSEWKKLDDVGRDWPPLLTTVARELIRVRDPSNAALIDEWLQIMESDVRRSIEGPTIAEGDHAHLLERLSQVRPVDRLARVF